MKIITSGITLLALVLVAGCGTTSLISPLIVEQGVATGVSYSVAQYPAAVPYLKAVAPIVCSEAANTNLAPAQVVAAIESSTAASALKTPEGVLILNGALLLYTGVWESYGSNTVASSAVLQTYLQATCNGMNEGLGTNALSVARKGPPAAHWSKVRF